MYILFIHLSKFLERYSLPWFRNVEIVDHLMLAPSEPALKSSTGLQTEHAQQKVDQKNINKNTFGFLFLVDLLRYSGYTESIFGLLGYAQHVERKWL